MGRTLTFLLVAVTAAGQKVYSVGDPGVTPPRVIESAGAEYSEEARAARLEGSAGVTFIVQEDAALRDVYVNRPLGLGLDEKAIEAVKQWKFAPGTKDEQPVPVLMRADVHFRLLTGRWEWHLTRAAFDVPKNAERPHVLEPQFPAAIERDGFSSVVVSFDIDEQGATSNVHVEASSGNRYEREVTGSVAGWKFQPAVQGGKPIRVRATFGFVAGQPPAPSNVAGAAVRPG